MMGARNLLGIAAGLALGYAIAGLLVLTVTDFGVGVAIAAACWVAIGALRWVENRRDATRIGREAVWLRRERAMKEVRR
jgi:uncharacterized membrane protein (UPF0136 family)